MRQLHLANVLPAHSSNAIHTLTTPADRACVGNQNIDLENLCLRGGSVFLCYPDSALLQASRVGWREIARCEQHDDASGTNTVRHLQSTTAAYHDSFLLLFALRRRHLRDECLGRPVRDCISVRWRACVSRRSAQMRQCAATWWHRVEADRNRDFGSGSISRALS